MKHLLIHNIPSSVVRKLYCDDNKSLNDLADFFDCSLTAVRNYMIKNSIPIRGKSDAAIIVTNKKEFQDKRREKLRGKPTWSLGQTWKHSEESKEKRSKASMGANNPSWKGGRTLDIEYRRQYRRNHKALRRNGSPSMPLWADKEKITAIYKEAKEKGLTVDHIIPLTHPLVCGLHCEDNLQIISKSENSSKNNSFTPG